MVSEISTELQLAHQHFADASAKAASYARHAGARSWDNIPLAILRLDGTTVPDVLMRGYLEQFSLLETGAPLQISPAAQLDNGDFLDPIRSGYSIKPIALPLLTFPPLPVLTNLSWGFVNGKPETYGQKSLIRKISLLQEELLLLPKAYEFYTKLYRLLEADGSPPTPELIRQVVFVPTSNDNSFRTQLSVSINRGTRKWADEYRGFAWLPGQGDPKKIGTISFEYLNNPNADIKDEFEGRLLIPVDPVNAVSQPYVLNERERYGIFSNPGEEAFVAHILIPQKKIQPKMQSTNMTIKYPLDSIIQGMNERARRAGIPMKREAHTAGSASIGPVDAVSAFGRSEVQKLDASHSPLIIITRLLSVL